MVSSIVNMKKVKQYCHEQGYMTGGKEFQYAFTTSVCNLLDQAMTKTGADKRKIVQARDL